MPSVDIVIVNRNSGPRVFESLSSIVAAVVASSILGRVWVVDDASTDGSANAWILWVRK